MVVWRLGLALTLLAGGSGTAYALRMAAPEPCPMGAARDPDRAEHVRRRLDETLFSIGTREAVRLQGQASEIDWCFGRSDELREDGGPLVLAETLDPDAAAGRAAHLLHHRYVAPVWAPDGNISCETKVSRAIAAERSALALEDRVRKVLGLGARPRRDLAALAASYGERCRRERR